MVGSSLSPATSGERSREGDLLSVVPWPPPSFPLCCRTWFSLGAVGEALPCMAAMPQLDTLFEAGPTEQAEKRDFHIYFSSYDCIIMMAFKLIVLGT